MYQKGTSIWEMVTSAGGGLFSPKAVTQRARVPDGWLVRYEYFGGEGKSASTLGYLPDKNGEWNLKSGSIWETVSYRRGPNLHHDTCRMKVPGGWLVREGYFVRWKHLCLDMVFVPDADHRWEISVKEDSNES